MDNMSKNSEITSRTVCINQRSTRRDYISPWKSMAKRMSQVFTTYSNATSLVGRMQMAVTEVRSARIPMVLKSAHFLKHCRLRLKKTEHYVSIIFKIQTQS